MNFSNMTSAHFIFIPAVLLVGVVIGWILGSRAAQDAYAAELRRREEREKRKADAESIAEADGVNWGPHIETSVTRNTTGTRNGATESSFVKRLESRK